MARSASVPQADERVGVILVEPLPVVREGISLLIDTQPDLEVLAQAGSVEEGLAALAQIEDRPGILALVNLESSTDEDAFSLIRRARETHSHMVILASALEAHRSVISRALASGADGFVHKRSDPVEFLEALRRAAKGETVIAGMRREREPGSEDGSSGPKRHGKLTARQIEVLAHAAEGLTARQIASRIGVKERTVTTHLSRIYTKLGVSGRVPALREADRLGLI